MSGVTQFEPSEIETCAKQTLIGRVVEGLDEGEHRHGSKRNRLCLLIATDIVGSRAPVYPANIARGVAADFSF
jgi:hypothetical protein